MVFAAQNLGFRKTRWCSRRSGRSWGRWCLLRKTIDAIRLDFRYALAPLAFFFNLYVISLRSCEIAYADLENFSRLEIMSPGLKTLVEKESALQEFNGKDIVDEGSCSVTDGEPTKTRKKDKRFRTREKYLKLRVIRTRYGACQIAVQLKKRIRFNKLLKHRSPSLHVIIKSFSTHLHPLTQIPTRHQIVIVILPKKNLPKGRIPHQSTLQLVHLIVVARVRQCRARLELGVG